MPAVRERERRAGRWEAGSPFSGVRSVPRLPSLRFPPERPALRRNPMVPVTARHGHHYLVVIALGLFGCAHRDSPTDAQLALHQNSEFAAGAPLTFSSIAAG